MLRGDVTVKGGITAMMKICHLAEALRMKCEIDHGGNSLQNVANLHVLMAVSNCEYFEVYLQDIAQKYALVKDIEVDKEGNVHAPEAPGLGYEIDSGTNQKEHDKDYKIVLSYELYVLSTVGWVWTRFYRGATHKFLYLCEDVSMKSR